MNTRVMKQGIVWGGALILIGILLLVDQFIVEVSPWVWFAFLFIAGLGALGLWLVDRSDGLMLLAAYILLAIAGLIALVPSGVLQDEAIALYVLPAIALPFLGVFIWDRRLWWALIPAYVLLAVGGVVILAEMAGASDDLVTAYVLIAIALPFFVVYILNRKNWWALIPGGILAVIGLSFLVAEGAFVLLGAAVLFIAGAWILVRAFTRREPKADEPPPTAPESNAQEES
jgi:hypothetical protein